MDLGKEMEKTLTSYFYRKRKGTMSYNEFVMKTSDHSKFPEGRVFNNNDHKMTGRRVCI